MDPKWIRLYCRPKCVNYTAFRPRALSGSHVIPRMKPLECLRLCLDGGETASGLREPHVVSMLDAVWGQDLGHLLGILGECLEPLAGRCLMGKT